jgi:hypothetical protein
MGRTEAGAGTGVPGTVQEVSIRGQRISRTETGRVVTYITFSTDAEFVTSSKYKNMHNYA